MLLLLLAGGSDAYNLHRGAVRLKRPTIELVNHACVIIDTGSERILCDPWLSGTAFDDGWEAIVRTDRTIADLDFSHIWISHEHPDHFSPRDLKGLPPERMARTPLLYQWTPDGKVAAFCRALGFKVRELAPGISINLSPRTRINCDVVSGYDSWLLVQSEGGTVLNLNDCRLWEVAPLKAIADLAGHIDVLLAQFGYANWVGNEGDERAARRAAGIALDKMRQQVATLGPDAFIPFASFVRCCHAENVFWNRHAVRLTDAIAHCEGLPVQTVPLFPGDVWQIGSPAPADALSRWQSAYAEAEHRRPIETPPVTVANLEAYFTAMRDKVRATNDWSAIEALGRAGDLPACLVYLTDLRSAISMDLLSGFKAIDATPEQCDIRLGSAAFANVLRHNWGRGTLTVNGRFQANYRTLWRFLRQTQIPYANNIGWRFPDQLTPAQLMAPNSFIHQLLGELAAPE